MTPVASGEGGRSGATLGRHLAQDRGGVAVLDDEGVVVFTGHKVDAERYMDAHGLREHANCEIVENRGYFVGFEAF